MAQNHVVIFPFMAYGHTLPLLDLSKAFSARGLAVTIVTTPSNTPSIASRVRSHPNISIEQIPFPSTPDLPEGVENTSQLPTLALLIPFIKATLQLLDPFRHVLRRMSESGSPPSCVISDFFMTWTAVPCSEFGVPLFVFHGMSVLTLAITKIMFAHVPSLLGMSDTEPVSVPGVNLPFSVTMRDMPESIRALNLADPWFEYLSQTAKWERQASGYILNSFTELEGEDYMVAFESAFESKAWCVGPMLLFDDEVDIVNANANDSSCELIKWMDNITVNDSVVYVSFGSQADIPDMQLDEVAYGLEASGHPFVWAVKSKTWAPPSGMEERIKGRGWIVTYWVDQRRILAHCATGGFLSHCGWNSVLESLCMGVPLLAWPLVHDQHLNARFVVGGAEVGLRVPSEFGNGIVEVERGVVCEAVRELMASEKGRKVRANAERIGKLAKLAVEKDGSSDKKLNEFISNLCKSRDYEDLEQPRVESVIAPATVDPLQRVTEQA